MQDELAKEFMAATSYYFHLPKLLLQHVDNIIHCITVCMGHLGIVYAPHDDALFSLHNSIGHTQVTGVKFKTTLHKVVGEEVVPQQRHLHCATQRFVQDEIESFMISLFKNSIQTTFINQAHHFGLLVCKFDCCKIILFHMDAHSFDVGGGSASSFLSFDCCR